MRAGVENSWGGRDSQAIAERTDSRVFDYFVQLEDPLDIYNGIAFHEVGAILMAGLDKLHIDAEDGNVEEITDKLLDLYEDCRDGFLKIIEELRSKSQNRAIVVKIPNGNDDEDEDEDTFMNDDQTTDMMVDGSEHYSNRKAEAMTVDEPANDDGWTVFSRRKNKGKRNLII